MFLQRKIRTLIVDANDWEPLLNRGAYSEGVASPDVKERLRDIVASLPNGRERTLLLTLTDTLKTAPTREMVASPAVLGNIAKEKVSELAVTVAKDIMNPLQEAIKKLGRQINPTILYIGLGLLLILCAYLAFQVGNLAGAIDAIKQSLGVQ